MLCTVHPHHSNWKRNPQIMTWLVAYTWMYFADLPGEVLEKNHFCQWPHQSHFLKMIFWRKHLAHWQHQCHQDLFQILFQIFHSLFQLDQWSKSQESQTGFHTIPTGSIFWSLACFSIQDCTCHLSVGMRAWHHWALCSQWEFLPLNTGRHLGRHTFIQARSWNKTIKTSIYVFLILFYMLTLVINILFI